MTVRILNFFLKKNYSNYFQCLFIMITNYEHDVHHIEITMMSSIFYVFYHFYYFFITDTWLRYPLTPKKIIFIYLLGSTLNRWSRCKPGFNPFTCTWDFFWVMYTGDHVIVKYQHET